MTGFLFLLAVIATVVAVVVWTDRHVPRDFLADWFGDTDYMAPWSDRDPGELPEYEGDHR